MKNGKNNRHKRTSGERDPESTFKEARGNAFTVRRHKC